MYWFVGGSSSGTMECAAPYLGLTPGIRGTGEVDALDAPQVVVAGDGAENNGEVPTWVDDVRAHRK